MKLYTHVQIYTYILAWMIYYIYIININGNGFGMRSAHIWAIYMFGCPYIHAFAHVHICQSISNCLILFRTIERGIIDVQYVTP